MALSIHDFKLEKIVLEIRYGIGFLYWDNCGRVWKDLTSKWPDLKAIQVSPEQASFKLHEKSIILQLDQVKCNITQDYPDTMDVFVRISEDFVSIVRKYLEVNVYKRIGNRYMFIFPFKNISDAIDFVNKSGLIGHKLESLVSKESKLSEAGVSLRFMSDDIGYILRYNTFSRSYEITLPPPFEIDSSQFIPKGVSFDVDVYTEKLTEAGIVKIDALIDTNLQRVRKLMQTVCYE